MRRIVPLVLFVTVFLLAAPWATAGTIFFRTGVDPFVITQAPPLGTGGPGTGLSPDPFTVPSLAVVVTNPITPTTGGQWVPNDLVSMWVGPENQATVPMDQGGNGRSDERVGDWVYEFSFFAPEGVPPDSLGIAGRWLADGFGIDILLNGNSTGQVTSLGPVNQPDISFGSYVAWTEFGVNSSNCPGCYLPGENVLSFVVHNGSWETGLRVEGEITIPEPATYFGMGGGLLLLAAFRRRRR